MTDEQQAALERLRDQSDEEEPRHQRLVAWLAAIACVLALAIVVMSSYLLIEIRLVQHSNTTTTQTTAKELKQLRTQNNSLTTIVNNDAASSAYLKTAVAGAITDLVYIGQAFTATCKAEPGCVIPPYPPKGTTP